MAKRKTDRVTRKQSKDGIPEVEDPLVDIEEDLFDDEERLPPSGQFAKIFKKLKSKDLVAIFMHRAPDPDSIGSARAMQWLLKKKFSLDSKIFYEGEVSHPQNRTMVNVLNIPLLKFEEYRPEEFAKTIILDATTKNAPIKSPTFVLDHHRVEFDPAAELCHIEQVGSVSTLVWEYIRDFGLEFKEELDELVATCLFFGVRVDTQELTAETTTDRDFVASQELVGHLNRKKLSDVINYPLPNYFFELEKVLNKEENNSSRGSFFIGTIGIISEAKRDSLPMLADKMVRMDGIETTVVFAVIGDNVEASIRSMNPAFDVNAFCHKVFGKDYSGGKLGTGGASVPLGMGSMKGLPDDITEELWQAMKKKLFHQVFHIAGDN